LIARGVLKRRRKGEEKTSMVMMMMNKGRKIERHL
jgi:hypothetical protein